MAEPPASVLRPLTATTRLLTRVPWESQQSLLSYSQTLFSGASQVMERERERNFAKFFCLHAGFRIFVSLGGYARSCPRTR